MTLPREEPTGHYHPQRAERYIPAMAEHDRVRLAGRVIALESLRRRPTDFAHWFTRARVEQGHAQCLCNHARLRLVIRQRQGRHYLAVWPGEGHRHTVTCWFHQEDQQSKAGAGATVSKAIEHTARGTTVRLDLPLQTRPSQERDTEPIDRGDSSSSSTHARTGLLGLLQHLWDQADLTRWRQGTRRLWGHCHQNLIRLEAGIRVNRLPLEQTLYVVPPYTPDRAQENRNAYDTWKSRLQARGQRGLLLGEIKTVQESRYGMRIQLSHLHAPVYARTKLIEKTKRSYRSVWAIQPTFARRVALIAVEPTTHNNLQAVDIAMMLTNHAYLPADSTHEVRMADALIKARRSLVKPLRYDTKESTLPDFVLTDTSPHTYVEVYGMLDDPAYRRRQEHKREHYRSTGTPLIEWDARGPMPELRSTGSPTWENRDGHEALDRVTGP